jgi:hypothetical protein
MRKHRNPQASVSKQAPSDNFNPGDAIELLYSELVEVEAHAVATNQRHEHAAPTARIVGNLGNAHLIVGVRVLGSCEGAR